MVEDWGSGEGDREEEEMVEGGREEGGLED